MSSDERVAQCERAITDLTRRLEALEARSPGSYLSEPRNPTADCVSWHRVQSTPTYPPGYPYPFGGTTDEED